METSASFEARSASSSYPTASQSGFCAALRRPTGNSRVRAAFCTRGDSDRLSGWPRPWSDNTPSDVVIGRDAWAWIRERGIFSATKETQGRHFCDHVRYAIHDAPLLAYLGMQAG